MNWWTTIRMRIGGSATRRRRVPGRGGDRELGGVPRSQSRRLVLVGQRRREALPPALPQVGDLVGGGRFPEGAADEGHIRAIDVVQAALGEAKGEVDVVERSRKA